MVQPPAKPSPIAKPAPTRAPDVVDLLVDLLAKTVGLYLETAVAHWNVEGPSFFELHRELGKQYGELVEDADRIAERIRALGETISIPPGADLAVEAETRADVLAGGLYDLRVAAAKACRELSAAAEQAQDPATANLAQDLAGAHEKRAWMLAAFLGSSSGRP